MSRRIPPPGNPDLPATDAPRRRGRPPKARPAPEAAPERSVSGNSGSACDLGDLKLSNCSIPDADDADDTALIQATLRQIMRDTTAPAAARAQAARTLAEIRQMLGRDRVRAPGEGNPDLRTLTAADLLAELTALGDP